jgi:hypothetical protein
MNILLRFLSIKIIYLAIIFFGLFSNNLKIKTSRILLKINNYWTLKNLQNNNNPNKKILFYYLIVYKIVIVFIKLHTL